MFSVSDISKEKPVVLGIVTVAFAVIARFLTLHLPNVAPFEAMLIFGVFTFNRRWVGLALSLTSWWITDIIINNTLYASYYEGFALITPTFLYASLAMLLIYLVVGKFQRIAVERKNQNGFYLMSSVVSPIIFFVVSNFGVWAAGHGMYPPTLGGLGMCYVNGLPFFTYGFASTVLFSVLFGVMGYLFQGQVVQASSKA